MSVFKNKHGNEFLPSGFITIIGNILICHTILNQNNKYPLLEVFKWFLILNNIKQI